MEIKEGLSSGVLSCSSLHRVHHKELQVNLRTVYLFVGHQPAGLNNRFVVIWNVGNGMNGGGDIHFLIVFFGFGRPTYQTRLLIPSAHAWSFIYWSMVNWVQVSDSSDTGLSSLQNQSSCFGSNNFQIFIGWLQTLFLLPYAIQN